MGGRDTVEDDPSPTPAVSEEAALGMEAAGIRMGPSWAQLGQGHSLCAGQRFQVEKLRTRLHTTEHQQERGGHSLGGPSHGPCSSDILLHLSGPSCHPSPHRQKNEAETGRS